MSAPAPSDAWSETDLQRLSTLARGGNSAEEMAPALGRSASAVRHALRKLLIQQCTVHSAQAVADAYDMELVALRRLLSPLKYYVPLQGPAGYSPWGLWFFTATVVALVAIGPCIDLS